MTSSSLSPYLRPCVGMEGQILTNAQDASSLQMGRFSSDSRVGSGGLGEEVCAIVAADLQSWGLLLPLCPPPHPPPTLTLPIIPNVSIFFSSQAPERRAESHSGGSSHILTPHCSPSQICSPCSPAITSSPSKTSRHITLIYSSLCYSQVAGLPTQPSKCLLVLPPLVQR